MDIGSVITKAEYESLGRVTYDQFCNYLTKVVKLCVEESLKALPHVSNHIAQQAIYLRELSDKFYKDNKDLVNDKPLVSKIIERIEADNPGMSYEEVLEKAAATARQALAKSKIADKTVTKLTPESVDRKLRTVK